MGQITKEMLDQLFVNCPDVHSQTFVFKNNYQAENVHFFYCAGLCDLEKIDRQIIPSLDQLFKLLEKQRLTKEILQVEWQVMGLHFPNNDQEDLLKVFKGELLVLFEQANILSFIQLAKFPQRTPMETNTEPTVKGARDSFIEEISVNIALIRKRLGTNSFQYKSFELGKRTKTQVALLYMEDIIQPKILQEITRRIEHLIELDELINPHQLEELLNHSKFPLIPIFDYTGRPDYVVDCLISGRFAILINGSPIALIGPVTLLFLLKSAEDKNLNFVYVSAERLLRIFGISIAIFLPAFYVALTSYHLDELPLKFLGTIVESRQGLPLNVPLEAVLMLMLFEIFREAGLRMPTPVGQFLTVVGGLIIGDAAIRAGLTSPALIVVIASSTVSTFLITNQSVTGIFSIIRFLVLLISSVLGLFGFLISVYAVVLYLASYRSFGLPYLAPLSPINFSDFISNVLRKSDKYLKRRPEILQTTDSTRRRDNQE